MINSFPVRRSVLGKKAALLYGGLFILMSVFSSSYLVYHFENDALQNLKSSLRAQSKLVMNLLPPRVFEKADRLAVHEAVVRAAQGLETRITVINDKGGVLADSARTADQMLVMDNHGRRPEILEAMRGRTASRRRFSQTTGKPTLYVAVPYLSEDEVAGVVRASLPVSRVEEILTSIRRPVLAGTAAAVVLVICIGLFLERFLTRRVSVLTRAAKRYARGDLSKKILLEGSDELNTLAEAMNKMAASLKRRIVENESEKANLEAVLANMAEGLIAVDGQTYVLLANASARAMFGKGEKPVTGQSLLELTKNAQIDTLMRRAVKEQQRLVEEVEFFQPEFRILRVSALGTAQKGEGVGGIIVFSDMTKVRRLENMRREFVANVSHELRTPLTSLRGFVETLLEGALEDAETSKKFLHLMDEDAKRLERLIDDLLELSKLDAGQVRLRKTPLNLSKEIDTVWETLTPRFREKEIRFENRIAGALPPVSGDRDKIRQVLVNLLDNAAKFNRLRGRVAAEAEEKGGRLWIHISDNGPGIPEEARERVFERFFRVDKARSRALGGTGLGLSIVKHIIEAHGGSVACRTRRGGGAVLSFSLPLTGPDRETSQFLS